MSADTDDLSIRRRSPLTGRERFSTTLFTGLNIAVFLVLTASVVAAGVLYSQGA